MTTEPGRVTSAAVGWDKRPKGTDLRKYVGYHRAGLRAELGNMGLFVKTFLIFLCKRHNKSPFGDVNVRKLAGFASWPVPSCFMRHSLHWPRPAGVGAHEHRRGCL